MFSTPHLLPVKGTYSVSGFEEFLNEFQDPEKRKEREDANAKSEMRAIDIDTRFDHIIETYDIKDVEAILITSMRVVLSQPFDQGFIFGKWGEKVENRGYCSKCFKTNEECVTGKCLD